MPIGWSSALVNALKVKKVILMARSPEALAILGWAWSSNLARVFGNGPILSSLSCHLNRCTVASADCQRAVHHEFHVARAACLEARSRYLFGYVGCGNEALRQTHVVLGNEQDAQSAACDLIFIERRRDVVDELRLPIGGRRLACEVFTQRCASRTYRAVVERWVWE